VVFKTIRRAIERLTAEDQPRLEELHAQYNDPVSRLTSWEPMVHGGTNFRSHKLVEVSPHRIEFQATIGACLFAWMFLLVGVGVAIAGVRKLGEPHEVESYMLMVFGLIFAGVGLYLDRRFRRPIVVDMDAMMFWRGRMPQTREEIDRREDAVALEQVHAIQIISEYVRRENSRGMNSFYYSHELNFVLHDGRRIHVVDHGNLRKLREDAHCLAELIGVPVWDAAVY